jgi:hypothetical protein
MAHVYFTTNLERDLTCPRGEIRGSSVREVLDAVLATNPTAAVAVAVHPDDPHTAWFVPAIKDERRIPVDGCVVVTRTRDGDKTCVAFGSTTGSCWMDDQGDH